MSLSPPNYFPVFLDLSGRKCVVVGGGEIASGKAASLADAGAIVTVVSPSANGKISSLAESGKLTWHKRAYRKEDLDPAFLVIVATDDPVLNREIARQAEGNGRNILYNAVDDAEFSNFIFPAIGRRGKLQVAVSTSGLSPLLGKEIRDEIMEKILTPDAEILGGFLGTWRDRVKSEIPSYPSRKAFWEELLDSGLRNLLKQEGEQAANDLTESLLEKAATAASPVKMEG